jgi:hypothetical protein
MNNLHKIVNRALKETSIVLTNELVRQKFKNAGISLTDQQVTEAVEQLKEGRRTFRLTADQIDMSRFPTPPKKVEIEFKGDEFNEVLSQVPDVIEDTIARFAEGTLRDLKKTLPTRVAAIKHHRQAFEDRVWNRWRKPFELFHLYLAVTNEAAAGFNKYHRTRASKKNDLVFEVLMRLQARGCQIALEILTLLEAGLADGAHARWRSLHEVTCVAMFVKEYGQNVANKYLLHDLVQAHRSAKRYQEWNSALGHRPLSKKTISTLERNFQIAKKKFGPSFGNEYGWAATELGKDKPNFADIEKAVGLEKLRPYYRWASDNVHANVSATHLKLGLPGPAGMLLAGSSDAGLADPGNGAAMSLLQLTITILTSKLNIDTLVICTILRRLEAEIGTEFLKANKALMKRSRSGRKQPG